MLRALPAARRDDRPEPLADTGGEAGAGRQPGARVAKPGAAQTLARQGFVVVPSDLRLFHFAYDGNVYAGWPALVTTDVAYHEWHLVFDKALRDLELQVLPPKLQKLVAGLLQAAHAQADALAATPVAGDAARIEQLYHVAAAELGLPARSGRPRARRRRSSTRTTGRSARRSSARRSTTRSTRRAATTRAPPSSVATSLRCRRSPRRASACLARPAAATSSLRGSRLSDETWRARSFRVVARP